MSRAATFLVFRDFSARADHHRNPHFTGGSGFCRVRINRPDFRNHVILLRVYIIRELFVTRVRLSEKERSFPRVGGACDPPRSITSIIGRPMARVTKDGQHIVPVRDPVSGRRSTSRTFWGCGDPPMGTFHTGNHREPPITATAPSHPCQ